MAYTPDPHLVFKDLASGVSAKLVFGEGETPVSATARGGITLRISPIGIVTAAQYDRNVLRDPAPLLRTAFDVADKATTGRAAQMFVADRLMADVVQRAQVAMPAGAATVSLVYPSPPLSAQSATRTTPADAVGASADQALQAALALTVAPQAVFEAAPAVGADSRQPLQWGLRAGLELATTLTPADGIVIAHRAPHDQAVVLIAWHDSGTQPGMQPRSGRSWIDPGINPPTPVCYTPSAHLGFKGGDAANPHLVFACDNALSPGEPLRVIPVRRAYLVINNVTLTRIDTEQDLVCESLDISVDADSWTCAWSATLAWSEYNALRAERGQPIELLASINGHPYRLLMEGAPKRQRSFGKWSVSIGGRGIAAALDSPYQDIGVRSNPGQDYTAQQLMADALTINGVSNGWSLDWRITDWLVPAGAWAHQGTPIAAVLDVAGAVGAIVQAADAAKTLRILPRYPVAPWGWHAATPDIQVPLDIITAESIEPVTRPGYNAVYVGGQSYGVTSLVKRQGTAGDVLAQTITHPLLTAAEATRQRGLAVLGDTGAQERISMSLPLSDDTGLIRINMLADVPDPDDAWRGLVRSVALSARWEDSAGLVVWQNIGLERHYAN